MVAEWFLGAEDNGCKRMLDERSRLTYIDYVTKAVVCIPTMQFKSEPEAEWIAIPGLRLEYK